MSANIPALKTAKNINRDADAVVVGLTSVGRTLTFVGVPTDLERVWSKQPPPLLLDIVATLGACNELGTLTALPPVPQRLVVVGLGDVDVTSLAFRHACGVAPREISGTKDTENLGVTISLELHDSELIWAAAEGVMLGACRIPRVAQRPQKDSVTVITLATGRTQLKEPIEEVGAITAAMVQARDWINTPLSLLYPETFAESTKAHVSDLKARAEILDEKALAKGGYGGILVVGGGSLRSPRLPHLAQAPRGAKFHLALVGKGITFDSGGLDIRPTGQMASMTCDMSGTTTMVVVTQAIVVLGLSVKVATYTTMVENLPSGTAYRSTNMLTIFDGTTVENTNTDVEGCPVIADALGRAGTDSSNLIMDVTTLTGVCMVALGKHTTGFMASGDAITDHLLDAAKATGEGFWYLPATDDIRESLRSGAANLRSSDKSRYGGALAAATFLRHFTPEGVSWAHLDIAGPTQNDKSPHGHTPLGSTGAVVRMLVTLMTQLVG